MIGIVLAAGHGRRLGGPKALLVVHGAPLAALHATRLFEAGCREVVVVVRAEVAGRVVLPTKARVAISAAEDPAGSIAVGLAHVATSDDELVLIAPVDVLPASVTTLAVLAAAIAAGAEAATPRRNGTSGHPVVARAGVLDAYRVGRTPRLCDVLDALGERRVRVAVEDDAVTSEINAPADAQRVLGGCAVFAG